MRFGPNSVQLFPNIIMRHNFDSSLQDTFRRSRYYGRASGRDWVKDRDIPTISPLLPGATVVSAVVAVASPMLALVILVLSPYLLYRRWFSWFKSSGSREAIIYPYVQAGEEIANNVGFVQGVLRELRVRRGFKPSSHEAES
jgi:hypothetical protein